jgi:hypothetical protein
MRKNDTDGKRLMSVRGAHGDGSQDRNTEGRSASLGGDRSREGGVRACVCVAGMFTK